ncbi:hypothetical protein PG994_014295 [Apiospora phragmitis]|uniref:Rhodopsin domain-containing protein n=1 Tax=Apiospora phragmitis TaxID=2905665 RepID=A0ABR1T3X7_9PEZI
MSTTDPTIQPPLDFSNTGPDIVITSAVLGFVSTIIVALRFWSRRLVHQHFGLSDYLCLAALLFQHGLLASGSVMVKPGGLGRDFRITATEDPSSVIILFQALFVAEITYTFSSPLIKLSVLAFYRKIFPTRTVNLGCKILGFMCMAWWIAIFILDFTQCRPLEAFWRLELQVLPTTKCIDPIFAFFSNSVANCIIDFFTIALPIRDVLKLQTTTRRKVNIFMIFLLGGVSHKLTIAEQFVVPAIASAIEIYVAIIGACLPMMVPIYRKLRFGDPLKMTGGGTQPNKTPSSGTNTVTAANMRRRNRELSGDDGSVEQRAGSEDGLTPADYHGGHYSRAVAGSPGSDNESYPLEAIKVRREITRHWQDRD